METSPDLQQQPRYSPHNHHHHLQDPLQRQFHPKPQFSNSSSISGGGLTRFRSAPSSYFGSLMNSVPGATTPATNINVEDLLLPRPLSPETETIISRFIHSVAGGSPGRTNDVVASSEPLPLGDVPRSMGTVTPPFVGSTVVKDETDLQGGGSINEKSNKDNNNSPIIYRAQPSSNKPPLAGGGHHRGGGGGLSRSNRSLSSSLMRHSSSPVGLFDDLHIENGYLVTQVSTTAVNPSNYNRNVVGSSTFTSTVPLPSQTVAAPVVGGQSHSSSSHHQMLTNPDRIGNEILLVDRSAKRLKIETDTDEGGGGYMSGFPVGSWDETVFSDLFAGGSERELDGGEVSHPSSSENQSPTAAAAAAGGSSNRNRTSGMLAHHMSLPKETLEKLLQFEDSVPCKIRAKRGCATHPRSIAERVRRTKISERMRKLQDLVPNMDKQTSTSEMLDLAVEHIKDLKHQLQMLTGKRARCTCPNW